MLSKLLTFTVIDDNGNRAQLADLAVKLLEGDYPAVTQLFYKSEDKLMCLPWDEILSVDKAKKQIKVTDFARAKVFSAEHSKEFVQLKNEILDALILDLQHRRPVRANDLQLKQEDGQLLLKAADASIGAILRRISFGLYRYVGKSGIYDWKYVEFLRGNPQAVRSGAGYHLRITRMANGDIARLTNFIPYLHAAELLTLLPGEKAAKVLELMSRERQLQVFEELDEKDAVQILALMSPDAAADLVGLLQTATMRRYLEKLPRKKSRKIIELLRYPDDTVGGIMTNDVAYLRADLRVAEARKILRECIKETDFVYLIYIVSNDDERHLRGVISLRNLFTVEDENQKLEDLMDPYLGTLSSTDAAIEAAYRVVDRQLPAMPVVGLNNKLIGAVTIDAAISAINLSNQTSENLRIFS